MTLCGDCSLVSLLPLQNGVLSAVPYILGALFSCLASVLSDCLRKRNVITITNNRKLFTSLGKYGVVHLWN